MQINSIFRLNRSILRFVINTLMLILSKMVNFNKIKKAVDAAGESWEKLGPRIGLTANGLRYSINNETLTLVKYTDLCHEIKIHPAFLYMKQDNPEEFFYKKVPAEVQFQQEIISELKNEIAVLKTKNSQLKDKLLNYLENEKKSKK